MATFIEVTCFLTEAKHVDLEIEGLEYEAKSMIDLEQIESFSETRKDGEKSDETYIFFKSGNACHIKMSYDDFLSEMKWQLSKK